MAATIPLRNPQLSNHPANAYTVDLTILLFNDLLEVRK